MEISPLTVCHFSIERGWPFRAECDMIDIVVLAVVLLFAVLGWKRGLVRTLTELLAVVLALVFSVQFARAAAPVVIDKALRPATYGAIAQRVEELTAENMPELQPVVELEQVVEAIPNGFIREQTQAFLAEIESSVQSALASTPEALEQAGKDVADAVLDGVVQDLVQALLCAAFFVVLTAVLRLLARVLRVVEKLPVVRQLNGLGGALIGLGKGLILVCLALWVLREIGVITPEMAGESVVLRLLSRGTVSLPG